MGLIRGMARTAVVAGTATAVSNRVSRRQAGRWAAQGQYPDQQAYGAPPQQPTYAPEREAPEADGDDVIDQLERLGRLHTSGVLTDAEFEAQKAKVLG
jgi:hypothetical protein